MCGTYRIESLARTLKDQNLKRLAAFAAANWFIFAAFWAGFPANLQIAFAVPAAISAIALTVVSIASGVLGPKSKARLVFWRWRNPLPGSRAFSETTKRDPRIDRDRLRKLVGSFPRSPEAQNKVWYGLYNSLKSEANVLQNHREYLFARDFASLSALAVPVMLGLGWVLFNDAIRASAYTGFLVLQYLVVRMVASNYGNRFVATVLAVKSTEGGKDGSPALS